LCYCFHIFLFYEAEFDDIVAVEAFSIVKLIVVEPPVSFPIIVIVAVLLSTNNVLAAILKLNPAAATLCASSLSPINLGTVGNTEAIPDETQALKYKLVTLPKQTTNIPVVSVGNNSIILPGPGTSAIISPNTANLQGGNANLGYTAILSDSSVADLAVTRALQSSVLPTVPRFIGDNEDAQSVAAAGFSFRIAAKTLLVESKTATITIIGNETGGSTTINLTIEKASTATISSNSAS
jgi:hypothetical protein